MPHPRDRDKRLGKPYCWQRVYFFDSLQSCAQTILMPQAMNIADAEAAVDKEWDKFKNLPALRESKVRRKLLNKHIKKEGRFILLLMSSSEFQCGKEVPNIQRPCSLPWRRSDGWLWLACCVHRARDLPRHTWQLPEYWTFPHCLIALAKRATQYQLASQWKWRTLQIYWDCPNLNVHVLDTSSTFSMSKMCWIKRHHFVVPTWKTFCTDIHWQDWCGSDTLENPHLKWECFLRSADESSFLFVYLDDMNMERRNTWSFCGKVEENVDFDEPSPLLEQVYLGCTRRECKTSKRIVEANRHIFESFLSANTVKSLPGRERSIIDTVHGSYSMDRTRKEMRLSIHSLSWWPLTFLKEGRKVETVGEWLDVCSQIVRNAFILRCTGRPDTLRSVNQWARANTKWSKACDKLVHIIHSLREWVWTVNLVMRLGRRKDQDERENDGVVRLGFDGTELQNAFLMQGGS